MFLKAVPIRVTAPAIARAAARFPVAHRTLLAAAIWPSTGPIVCMATALLVSLTLAMRSAMASSADRIPCMAFCPASEAISPAACAAEAIALAPDSMYGTATAITAAALALTARATTAAARGSARASGRTLSSSPSIARATARSAGETSLLTVSAMDRIAADARAATAVAVDTMRALAADAISAADARSLSSPSRIACVTGDGVASHSWMPATADSTAAEIRPPTDSSQAPAGVSAIAAARMSAATVSDVPTDIAVTGSAGARPGAAPPPRCSCTRTADSGTFRLAAARAAGENEGCLARERAASASARSSLMRSQERCGVPPEVKLSSRSATATTTPGMFHDLPQMNRTSGGRPPAPPPAQFSANRHSGAVRLRTSSRDTVELASDTSNSRSSCSSV